MSDKLPIGEPLWTPDDTIAIEVGTVEHVTEESDRPVCVLWLIDPEQRHGWREYYVKRQIAVKPGQKPMGYRKP